LIDESWTQLYLSIKKYYLLFTLLTFIYSVETWRAFRIVPKEKFVNFNWRIYICEYDG